jgi:hypothetical protein
MNKKAGSLSKYATKAGGRLWRYRFDGDAVDGKRQVISKQGLATRGAAFEALQVAIKEFKTGKCEPIALAAPKETVSDWLRAWLRDYAPQRCTPKTIERYHQLAGYIVNVTEGEPAPGSDASRGG